ncbi:MAG: T9SS type A sorting domain-containing protein [Bacteroidota bacterium]
MLSTKKSLLGALLIFLGASGVQLNAQSSKSFGEVFIPNKAAISIFNKHTFHDGSNGMYPGVIATERTDKKGYINFAKGSSWIDASDMQHVDGYVKVFHDDAFTFPIGANSRYRPIAISGASRTSAAYYDSNPNAIDGRETSEKEVALTKISASEYWDIDGDNRTQVTLTWDAISSVETLTDGNLNRLTIIGWRGNQWEIIPSSIDRFILDKSDSDGKMGSEIADFVKGSITTDEVIRPNDYDFISLGALNESTMAKMRPEFDVYPNPVSLTLTPSLNYQFSTEEGGTVRLYSPNNVLLLEREVSGQRGNLTLDNPIGDAGIYIIGIIDSNGSSRFEKLVVVEK